MKRFNTAEGKYGDFIKYQDAAKPGLASLELCPITYLTERSSGSVWSRGLTGDGGPHI